MLAFICGCEELGNAPGDVGPAQPLVLCASWSESIGRDTCDTRVEHHVYDGALLVESAHDMEKTEYRYGAYGKLAEVVTKFDDYQVMARRYEYLEGQLRQVAEEVPGTGNTGVLNLQYDEDGRLVRGTVIAGPGGGYPWNGVEFAISIAANPGSEFEVEWGSNRPRTITHTTPTLEISMGYDWDDQERLVASRIVTDTVGLSAGGAWSYAPDAVHIGESIVELGEEPLSLPIWDVPPLSDLTWSKPPIPAALHVSDPLGFHYQSARRPTRLTRFGATTTFQYEESRGAVIVVAILPAQAYAHVFAPPEDCADAVLRTRSRIEDELLPNGVDSDCDDQDACTIETRCAAECFRRPVTSCNSGDGCCPSGCQPRMDSDCEMICGDGVLHDTEPCDNAIPIGEFGACPIDCDDGYTCTDDELVGSRDDCSAQCIFTFTDRCVHSDGCCANGCDQETDNDCGPCTPFCDLTVNAVCRGEDAVWPDFASCQAECVLWAEGMRGDMAGDTLACREYYQELAVMDPGTHCVHLQSVGGGVCE